MPIHIAASDENNQVVSLQSDKEPDLCPACRSHGQPNFITAALISRAVGSTVHAVFRCPVRSCRALYIANYRVIDPHRNPSPVSLQTVHLARFVTERSFPKNISNLSQLFCKTYNQAMIAEANGLDQICGPGYRKALEFLVKDYLIACKYKEAPDRQEEVRKGFLSNVIETHIDDDRIKQCAKRAVWLGNDQTHYTRKWEDKDIQDLKSLVMMTVNYIELTQESERYLREMPANPT